MLGVIRSYSAEKGFGFVDGKDGVSYFMHKNQLADKSQAPQLKIGINIEFDPTPTPKGMQANKVRLIKTFIGKQILGFEFSRKGEPRGTEIAWEFPIVWPMTFTDFNKAEQAITAFAKEVGVNAVLNFKIEKETHSSGNYYFTVGRPKFTLAILTKNVQVTNQGAVETLDKILSVAVASASRVEDMLADMNRPVEVRKTSSSGKALVILMLMFAGFVLLGVLAQT